MSWKKVIIFVALIFLVSTIIRFYMYHRVETFSKEVQKLEMDAREKADEANKKYTTFYLRDLVKTWKEQTGSFYGFKDNDANIEKVNNFTSGNKNKYEYAIFTTRNSYVVKVKPNDEKIIYCVDNKIAKIDPWIKIIGFTGDNLNSSTDCDNIDLK